MSNIASEVLEALQRRHPQAAIVTLPDGRLEVRGSDGTTATVWAIAAAASELSECAARIARSGLLRSLPAGVAAGIVDVVATASCGDVVLALDRPRLSDVAIDGASTRQVLGALARMHAVFAGFPARLTSGLGLLPLGQWLTLRRPEANSPTAAIDGWRRCAARLPEQWPHVDALLTRPAPLVEALRGCQPTIVAGNAVPAELTVEAERVILHDWTLATRGPGTLDLGLFIAGAYGQSPLSVAECVEVYRTERAAAGRLPAEGELWQRELALGLLAGFLRYGWDLGTDADDLAEWQQIIADGCAAIG